MTEEEKKIRNAARLEELRKRPRPIKKYRVLTLKKRSDFAGIKMGYSPSNLVGTLEEFALLSFIISWSLYNEAKGKEDDFKRQDEYWTFFSVVEFREKYYQCMSKNVITSALKRLVNSKLIIASHQPNKKSLRSKWYRPNYSELGKKGFPKSYFEELFGLAGRVIKSYR